MANSFGNPVVLDTFGSAIDVGNSKFGNSNAMMKIDSIIWQTPTTQDHTALVTDADSVPIFAETCVTAKESITRYFTNMWVKGIKIGVSGVGSGKIIINLQ